MEQVKVYRQLYLLYANSSINKIVDFYLQNSGPFQPKLSKKSGPFYHNCGPFCKIVDLLFEKGGSSEPREPPGYGA